MTNLSLPNGLSNGKAFLPIKDEFHQHNTLASNRVGNVALRVAAIEFLVAAGTCFLASILYFAIVLTVAPSPIEYIGAALVFALLLLVAAVGFKQYTGIHIQPRDRYMSSGLGAVTLGFSLFLSLLFVSGAAHWYSRGTFLFQFVTVSVAILITRALTHSYVHRAIRSGTVDARRAILVGDTNANGDILENLRLFGVRWVGAFQLPCSEGKRPPGDEMRIFVETCRGLRPDDILVLAEPSDMPGIAHLADALSELPTAVHIIPTGMNALWRSAKVGNFAGTPTVQVLSLPLSAFDRALKRGFDVFIATLGLFLLGPSLFIVSLAIRLDSKGPVLFRQRRHGYNNDVIPVLKFRTMTVAEDGETPVTFTQARGKDPRVTRVGWILRRTNIDELPQLINVLRGEMSIVGPRPHPIALNAVFQERIAPFSRRHNVKPGLTGWAQVNGFRGETNTVEKMQQRINHDLYYIDNWSFGLDLKIIMMTLFSKNGYVNAY
jgi:Undecaprenyl-phosphate glucose phosphotransferase